MDVEQLKTELTPVFGKYGVDIVAAYLFGSTAKGTASHSSDIDIAVLTSISDKGSRADLKLNLYADLCRKMKRNDIDLVMLNLSGNLVLSDDIVRNGIVLYSSKDESKNDFELNVLHRSIDFKLQRRYAMGV